GLLYGKKTKWLGKTNRIKSYYWFARALQNPQKNKAEPESLRYIEDILDSYRNGFKPRQMNLIRYYLETPDYIMPLLSGPRTFSK
nr:hypothetical protein [Nitrospinaceae bacterium]NIR57854.1 hypothetical protein [Nitrospinaceae bacterium]NIS88313.1 hypothetical protein [Nitrospinaceae bacterium]NIT85191.1 hypothetical protein [Nitrospinaceae bacterium]NIU47341.1 hypothetical protein [Nitrospinaceae bacterium]